MKVRVLIDNNSNNELKKEWGLSLFIENDGKKYLLDGGSSEKFAENADRMKINLQEVNHAVLSHAHYDHSNGIDKFFKVNSKADLFLQEGTGENCYHHHWWIINEYIGIRKGTLKKYQDRIKFAKDKYKIEENVYLIPHSTPGLEKIGKVSHLYIKEGNKIVPDSFKHEQSLVFKTDKGIVIFNSCSHGGADNIIKEVQEAFPEEKIYAIIGGFHLFCLPDEKIKEFAKRLNDTGIEKVITGHCTGQRAFEILSKELNGKVYQMYSGMEIEF